MMEMRSSAGWRADGLPFKLSRAWKRVVSLLVERAVDAGWF